jgi:hypothetical protein
MKEGLPEKEIFFYCNLYVECYIKGQWSSIKWFANNNLGTINKMERLSFQEHNRCEHWSAFTLANWILHLRICKWSLLRFFYRPDSQFLIRRPCSPTGAARTECNADISQKERHTAYAIRPCIARKIENGRYGKSVVHTVKNESDFLWLISDFNRVTARAGGGTEDVMLLPVCSQVRYNEQLWTKTRKLNMLYDVYNIGYRIKNVSLETSKEDIILGGSVLQDKILNLCLKNDM